MRHKRGSLRLVTIPAALVSIVLAAGCGSTGGERALSGAGIGAALGAGAAAVSDGDVATGAAVGGVVGGVTGALTDEDQIDIDD